MTKASKILAKVKLTEGSNLVKTDPTGMFEHLEETPDGWVVLNKDKSKTLFGPTTKDLALKRLRQIEYFKTK